MELSELRKFAGKYYTCCDRTGIIYEVIFGDTEKQQQPKLFPRYILNDGDGSTHEKGFKCEWMAEKDGFLYVGSIGKPWTSRTGEWLNNDPMYVKRISQTGEIVHESWVEVYKTMNHAANPGVDDPEFKRSYVVHEAAEYNRILREWIFLPRRISNEKYDDEKEVFRGANKIIRMDSKFGNPRVIDVKSQSPNTRGFSSIKFFPDNPREFVALKTDEEFETGAVKTYLTVLNVDGDVLVPETLVENDKLEGIEFID